MSVTVYKKTALTGGGASALDGISGPSLLDGDLAFVTVSNVLYAYILDDDSGATESSPDVISPDTTPGNKRWILQSCRTIPATVAEAVAGTDTTKTVTAAGNQASEAIVKNALAFAQGLNQTYASSGSTGIEVADNGNIDFGTQNFTLRWVGSLPDWTPSAEAYLFYRYEAAATRTHLTVTTTGYLKLYINTATFTSTIANSFVDGTTHEIVAVVVRETASVAGSVTFYVDGYQFGDAVAITAGAPASVTTATSLYVSGTSSVRTACNVRSAVLFNRGLTAAQVLSLYRNGIDFADKWGSQTALYSSNFSVNQDSWSGAAGEATTGNVDGINGSDDWLKIERSAGAGAGYCLAYRNGALTANKLAKVTLTIYNPAGSGFSYFSVTHAALAASVAVIAIAEGVEWTGTIYLNAVADSTQVSVSPSSSAGFWLTSVAEGKNWYLKTVITYQAGAVLALEPEGIQPTPGQWLDSSSNKLHGWQPAAGSSLIRYKNTFEIRGMNTWAGTHEAQSIAWATDASKAILPTKCYIDEIVGVIAGGTIEDIIIGDGSDTDRWVAITTGLAAGTTSFTLANRISDGTNYELVVDPDTNTTMTITWTIRGHILD